MGEAAGVSRGAFFNKMSGAQRMRSRQVGGRKMFIDTNRQDDKKTKPIKNKEISN